MAAGDDWGQGSVNNTNGFGKGAENNTISWGLIHGNSYGHPRTNLTGGGGFVGLFDQYGYPAFGASMRLLGTNYTGGLVRVRAFDASADQGTADVMPYDDGSGEQFIDLNSTITNLDATAIGRGLTTSDTLGDLLSSGVSNYDGFVTTWYDQSGNANDATQGTAASQPQIASAGSLILEGSTPLIDFQSLDFMNLPTLNLLTTFSVQRTDTLAQANYVLQNASPTGGLIVGGTTSGINGTGLFDGASAKSMTNTETGFRLTHWYYNGSNFRVANNGSAYVDLAAGANAMSSVNAIGRSNGVSATQYLSKSSEIIGYSTDESANKSAIETNINNAFTIYP